MRYQVVTVATKKGGETRIPKGDPEWRTNYLDAYRLAMGLWTDLKARGLNASYETPHTKADDGADYIVVLSEHGDHDEEVPESIRNPFVPKED